MPINLGTSIEDCRVGRASIDCAGAVREVLACLLRDHGALAKALGLPIREGMRLGRRSDRPAARRFFTAIPSLALSLLVWGLSSPAISAGDPVAGGALYAANCSGCHRVSPPVSSFVDFADGVPAAIGNHLSELADLGLPLGLAAPQLAHIAAYLAEALNYEGLWWNPAESGWGVSVAHQGDTIFAVWFGYSASGNGRWVAMTASRTPGATYSGTLYATTGPAFDAVPFDPAQVTRTAVGTATLTFTGSDSATFAYTLGGVSQTQTLARYTFGPLPSCASASGELATATNYQDLWWAAPAGSESGWGIHFVHQADTIVATWFTYDTDHSPIWLGAAARKVGPNAEVDLGQLYVGTLYRATGPVFGAMPFDSSKVVATAVGEAVFVFRDGNDASFAYIVNGIWQAKTITRTVFRPPGTVCR